MTVDSDRLTDHEHDTIYERVIRPDFITEDLTSQEYPRAIILAGQPGAGKGHLCREALEELEARGGAVRIDPDELREYHKYAQFLAEPSRDMEAAARVHEDASQWAKALRRDVIAGRYDLVVDTTLGNPDGAEKLCRELRENGYEIEVRAMAVKPEISRLVCLQRFEEGKAHYEAQKGSCDNLGLPMEYREDAHFYRYVPREVHDEAYRALPDSLERIEKNGLADKITVSTRSEHHFYIGYYYQEYDLDNNARTALENERSRELTQVEQEAYRERLITVGEQMRAREATPQDLAVWESFTSSQLENKTEASADVEL